MTLRASLLPIIQTVAPRDSACALLPADRTASHQLSPIATIETRSRWSRRNPDAIKEYKMLKPEVGEMIVRLAPN